MITIELREELTDEAIRRARQAVSAAVHKAAARIEAGAKLRAPVDTGNLWNSIMARREGELTASVGVSAEYAAAVEFGTGGRSVAPGASKRPIVIVPIRKRALWWPGARHPVRRVVQQGQPARPYLVPAVEEERPRFAREIAAAVGGET